MIKKVMAELGARGGRKRSEAQLDARRLNAEKARAARKLKRESEAVLTTLTVWPEHSPR